MWKSLLVLVFTFTGNFLFVHGDQAVQRRTNHIQYPLGTAGPCLDDVWEQSQGGTGSDHLYGGNPRSPYTEGDPNNHGRTGTGDPGCSASNFEFLRVSGFSVEDIAAQAPCNCDCHAYNETDATFPNSNTPDGSCDACTVPLAEADGEVSCCFEGRCYEKGTVFGACLGDDDYVQVNIRADFDSNSQATSDIGMYIATDGGKLTDRCFV